MRVVVAFDHRGVHLRETVLEEVRALQHEVVGAELAAELVRAFVSARFDGGERYVRRLEKIEEMEGEKTYG